jgi:hypothetical protein
MTGRNSRKRRALPDMPSASEIPTDIVAPRARSIRQSLVSTLVSYCEIALPTSLCNGCISVNSLQKKYSCFFGLSLPSETLRTLVLALCGIKYLFIVTYSISAFLESSRKDSKSKAKSMVYPILLRRPLLKYSCLKCMGYAIQLSGFCYRCTATCRRVHLLSFPADIVFTTSSSVSQARRATFTPISIKPRSAILCASVEIQNLTPSCRA